MAYTIRRKNHSKSNNNIRELSDFIPCYNDSQKIIGFKKYTITLPNERVYVNFFDENKKFFLRKISELDKLCISEKFSAYAL